MVLKKINVVIAVVVVVVLASSWTAYKYMSSQNDLLNPDKKNSEEVETIVTKVSKLILLPENERPQVAVISDINQLKNQSFFEKAQNGDRVIMYLQAKKAIVYRPSTNKLIEVGPINVTGTPTNAATQEQNTFVVPSGTPSKAVSQAPSKVAN